MPVSHTLRDQRDVDFLQSVVHQEISSRMRERKLYSRGEREERTNGLGTPKEVGAVQVDVRRVEAVISSLRLVPNEPFRREVCIRRVSASAHGERNQSKGSEGNKRERERRTIVDRRAFTSPESERRIIGALELPTEAGLTLLDRSSLFVGPD